MLLFFQLFGSLFIIIKQGGCETTFLILILFVLLILLVLVFMFLASIFIDLIHHLVNGFFNCFGDIFFIALSLASLLMSLHVSFPLALLTDDRSLLLRRFFLLRTYLTLLMSVCKLFLFTLAAVKFFCFRLIFFFFF